MFWVYIFFFMKWSLKNRKYMELEYKVDTNSMPITASRPLFVLSWIAYSLWKLFAEYLQQQKY